MEFQQETRLEMILSEIIISILVKALEKSTTTKGPKGYKLSYLIYALIAMQVEKIQTVKDLVLNLKKNPVLRYFCGFEVLGRVPSEATFSRLITKLKESEGLKKLFHALILKAKDLDIIDGTTVAIDATKLDAFEAPIPKSKITDDGTNPNWGKKKDTHGNDVKWYGWKLHILCDIKSELPLDIL